MKGRAGFAPKGLWSPAQGFNPGNYPIKVRPHKALPRSALLEKHPVRRVGGAEGAAESSYATTHPPKTRLRRLIAGPLSLPPPGRKNLPKARFLTPFGTDKGQW